jgi:Protein of unknown function (DUF3433)
MSDVTDPGSSALPNSESSRSEIGLVLTDDPLWQAADTTLSPPLELALRPLPSLSSGPAEGAVIAFPSIRSRPATMPTAQEGPVQGCSRAATSPPVPPPEQPEALPTIHSRVAVDPNEVLPIELATMPSPPVPPDVAETHVDSVAPTSSRLATIITAQEPPAQETPAQETPVHDTSASPTISRHTTVPAVQETPALDTPVETSVSPISSHPAIIVDGQETATQGRSVRDTSVPLNGSSLTATSTAITTEEARSFRQNDSTVRLVDSTRDSQSCSARGQPLLGDSVNDGRGSTSPLPGRQIRRPTTPPRQKWWRPLKIRPLWLSILLIVTVSLAITILVLFIISSENQGFTPLWDPPPFLARLPAFENNIWSQGVLYTSLPAFFMALYTMMFSSTVTCFMDLQPLTDLAKPDGATARTTIMLDYRRYSIFKNAFVAFQNKHFLLAFYMLLSTALTIAVVPLTAFLFVSSPVNANTTAPISFTTAFNESSLLALPDFELAMDFAAAFRIYDASSPPWTDGEYAFPKVVPLNTDTENMANSNLTVGTTGYSAYIDCRIIPEEEYNLTVVDPIGSNLPATIIQISANDRGCAISKNFIIQPKSSFPGEQTNTKIITTWMTASCTQATGYSRLSIASGLYSQSLTNFSLISCIPSYWTTLGALTLTRTSLTGPPLVHSFSANENQAVESRSVAVATYFESNIQNIGCVNPTTDISAFAFGRQVYVLASKAYPESPLLPEALSNAAQKLFTSIYAVLVSTSIFQPISPAINSTGIKTTTVTRLVVMVPMAYTILLILCGVVLAIATMFWYGRKPNVLDEEPTGLLSSALILHNSNVTQLIGEVQRAPEYDGRMIEGLERRGVGRDTRVIVESYSPLRVIVLNLETELH